VGSGPLLRQAAPAWRDFHRARQSFTAAYAALSDTADQYWQAALLRLADARIEVLAAAGRWDNATYPLSELREKVSVDALEHLADFRAIGATVDVDTIGWEIPDFGEFSSFGGCFRSPAREQIEQEIRAQDERLHAVAELSGVGTGRRR
jgi:hypothetical protein